MTESLARVVKELRGQTRLGQRDFAAAAKIGKNTLSNIESGKPGAKPETLRLIAEAAVREAAGVRSGQQDVEAIYQRLLIAAGHLTAPREAGPVPPAPDPLIERLQRVFGPHDTAFIADWLDETRDYTPADRKFTVQVIEWMQEVMRGAREYRDGQGAPKLFTPNLAR